MGKQRGRQEGLKGGGRQGSKRKVGRQRGSQGKGKEGGKEEGWGSREEGRKD